MKKRDNLKRGAFDLGFDVTVMLIIALISVFFVLWPQGGRALFYSFVNAHKDFLQNSGNTIMNIVQGALNIFGVIALIGIAVVVFRFSRLRTDFIKDMLDIMPEPSAPKVAETRWKIIKEKALSQNASERKIAIIEADAMLDEMVKKMGYSGETLAERLKNIETSDFLTLNLAWEAHKFRNKIAHEAHEVNIRDARRVMDLYEQVFQEFTYI